VEGWRRPLNIVPPATVIAWHRPGFRWFWMWKSHRRTGRPPVTTDVRALIRTMSEANPLWGAPRIHRELLKLGIAISQAAKYMVRCRRPPSQTWRTFPTNHKHQLVAADFSVVPTVTYRLWFVLVLLADDRRRVVHVAVTAHPTAAWTAQQLHEAYPGTRRLVTSFAIVITLAKDTPIPRPIMATALWSPSLKSAASITDTNAGPPKGSALSRH
jgi:hypothetical protein